MSALQRHMLALWAAFLSAVVCLVFLPLSRLNALLLMLTIWALIAVISYIASRRQACESTLNLDNLPDVTYRQPIVLVCGDVPQSWPNETPVLTVTQGCWIRVENYLQIEPVVRQLLWQRPGWGRQLAVMVMVCPQQHSDTESLTSRLLALRWQISQLRKASGHSIPLVLNGLAGSAIMNDMLWQSVVAGETPVLWRAGAAPCSVTSWIANGGASAMRQQVLINYLMCWFQQHVSSVFVDENPDIPPVSPAAVVWGMGPALPATLAASLWTAWLQRHTALQNVAGWQPIDTAAASSSLLPDFIFPLLPTGQGLTPRQRAWRSALSVFTLAAAAALCSSGCNNRQLLQRLSFDIRHYNHISMDDYEPKARAVTLLRTDAAQLDDWARNGEPLRMSLGLYQGGRLRLPLLEAIRSYLPPPPPPEPAPVPEPPPSIVRLDSMSLFDSGKAALKPGSTRLLVNSLLGIKAKPGWLIVVAGHTDNTGSTQKNQALSLKRAEAVRDWMRDSGDVAESCFAVQGYGESRPVADNDTPEGRALNRRVEISLVPQEDACQAPDAE
ncbi:OmpA family protein [Mixta intestinalis]|uniref:Outer membrane porin F n=1 Tax=Mixta intestinalis TaxID=1615494 RepID=A0A6P1Q245_9GAMM|nr:OmpA family protein [Mixta intestinalis]QHM71915.1 Outer membrane porin F [Mixta intestinalis]